MKPSKNSPAATNARPAVTRLRSETLIEKSARMNRTVAIANSALAIVSFIFTTDLLSHPSRWRRPESDHLERSQFEASGHRGRRDGAGRDTRRSRIGSRAIRLDIGADARSGLRGPSRRGTGAAALHDQDDPEARFLVTARQTNRTRIAPSTAMTMLSILIPLTSPLWKTAEAMYPPTRAPTMPRMIVPISPSRPPTIMFARNPAMAPSTIQLRIPIWPAFPDHRSFGVAGDARPPSPTVARGFCEGNRPTRSIAPRGCDPVRS